MKKGLYAAGYGIIMKAATVHAEDDPFDRILGRYRSFLLEAPSSVDGVEVQQWRQTLREDGSWEGIRYESRSKSNWSPGQHLKRMGVLANLYCRPGQDFYQKPELKEMLGRALDFWLKKRPSSENWWHNEIGVPWGMRDFLVLFESECTPERRAGALEVLAQFRVRGTGANLTWSADMALHHAALRKDGEAVAKLSRLLAEEIRVGSGEGIQEDYSFHQHDVRLQQFHYGHAFLSDNIRLAWELDKSPWAFPDGQIKILQKLVLEGSRWMQRRGFTVPGALDRAVSRPAALNISALAKVLPLLAEIDPEYAAEYEALRQNLNREGGGVEGYRHFPRSDFSVYHRALFSFFLKTRSDRTLDTEVGLNGENLKGKLLTCGDAYVMREGDEYFDLPPVWNWDLLPGLTWAAATDLKGSGIRPCSFAGAVSDGQSGLTVMDYRFGRDANGWTAKKAWFAHGDRIVFLTGSLRSESKELIFRTALDQSRWSGRVTMGFAGGVVQEQKPLEAPVRLENVSWIHHRGLAYLLMEPGELTLEPAMVRGRWKSLSVELSDTELREQVFLPVLEHGKGGREFSAAYVVAPCDSPEAAARLSSHPGFKVLKNEGYVQAVSFEDGTTMVAFYGAGKVIREGLDILETDKPCLILLSGGKTWISDPSQKGGVIQLRVGGKAVAVPVPAGGVGCQADW